MIGRAGGAALKPADFSAKRTSFSAALKKWANQ